MTAHDSPQSRAGRAVYARCDLRWPALLHAALEGEIYAWCDQPIERVAPTQMFIETPVAARCPACNWLLWHPEHLPYAVPKPPPGEVAP